MNKLPLPLLLFLPLITHLEAQTSFTPMADGIQINLRDSSNSGILNPQYVAPPPSSGNGFLVFDGVDKKPRYATLDPVLTYAGQGDNLPLSVDFTGLNLADYGLGDVLTTAWWTSERATMADVAFTGDYDDLVDKPTIPAAQVNADWSASSGVAQILNKPVLFSGAYADLTGKPTLFSGDYNDLTNKPTIPAAQVNSDWNAVSGLSQIPNKPSIPAAQVNADWSASSGVSQILNKPTLFSGAYADLTGKPTLGTAAAQNSTAFATAAQGANADSAVQPATLTAGLATKFDTPTGNTGQYVRGNGTLATFPTIPTAVSQLTNDSGFVTTAGARSAISLTTTGTTGAATYSAATGVINIPVYASAFAISAPSVGNALTSGTAFQPRSGGPCQILVNTNVSGLVGVGGTVTIAMSATSGGTYNTVSTDGVSITVLTLGDKASGTIPVPAGWWVRVTYTPVGLATMTGNYTRWDLN